MGVVRPVSGVERLWLAAGRFAPPFAIHVILDGDGEVPLSALRDAARELSALRLRVAGVAGWSRWCDDAPEPPVEPLPSDWDGLGSASFLGNPLAPERGQSARLWTGPGRVVLQVHHAAADGRAALLLMRTLLDTASQRRVAAVGQATTDFAVARQLRTRFVGSPPDDCLALLPRQSPPSLSLGWRRIHVPPVEGSPLGQVLERLQRLQRPGETYRVDIPVDLRRHVEGPPPTGNLTGLLRLPFDTQALDRAAMQAQIEAGEHLHLPLSAQILRWLPISLVAAIGRYAALRAQANDRYSTSATVSNLGRVDLSHYSTPSFRARRVCVVAPGSPGLPLFLTLTGYEGGLDLAAAAPTALADGPRLDGLLAELAEGLRSGA